MCYGKITQCQRCGSIDAPIPTVGPGRCDQVSIAGHVVISPSTDVPTCSSCHNQDMHTIQTLQAAAERQRQKMILRDKELQRIQAQEVENEDIFPDSFQDWCSENNDTQLPGSGFSAESALDADIRDYLEYLQHGPFDLEYRDEFQFQAEEMRASEHANFDFAPYEQPYLNRFQRWMRFMEADSDSSESSPSTLTILVQWTKYRSWQQENFLVSAIDWNSMESHDKTIPLALASVATWVSHQDTYHSMFNDTSPRQALLRDIENYQIELIDPLGPTSKALAWHNLVHNIQLAAEQLFDFYPPVNIIPLLSFRNFRMSEAGVMSSDSFDSALSAYESYLMRMFPEPRILDAFRATVNCWTAADRSQLEGLPRVDHTMIRLRILNNHFTHLLNAATAAGRGGVVREVVLPAQRLLDAAVEQVFWPSRRELRMLQDVFDQGWNVAKPGFDRPRLDRDDFEGMMFEYEELRWDDAGNLYPGRRYWVAFEG